MRIIRAAQAKGPASPTPCECGRLATSLASRLRARWLVAALIAFSSCSALAFSYPAAVFAEELEGRVVVEISDDFINGRSSTDRYLQTGGKRLRLLSEKPFQADPLMSGTRISVSGVRTAEGFRVQRMRTVGTGSRIKARAAFTGPRKVLVMVSEGRDPAAFSRAMFSNSELSVKRMIEGQSAGTQTLVGDVAGPYGGLPAGGCDEYTAGRMLRTAAIAAGYNPDAYDHEVYVLPSGFDCGWAGRGALGGSDVWIMSGGAKTLAHELGHNFGLDHANSSFCDGESTPEGSGWSPLPPVTPGTRDCETREYGDVNDYMGSSAFAALSANSLQRIGARDERATVTALTPGTFTLGDAFDPNTPLRELKVPWKVERSGDVSGYLSIEARRPRPDSVFEIWDLSCPPISCSRDEMLNGVLIRSVTGSSTSALTYKTYTETSQIWPVGALLEDASRNLKIRCRKRVTATPQRPANPATSRVSRLRRSLKRQNFDGMPLRTTLRFTTTVSSAQADKNKMRASKVHVSMTNASRPSRSTTKKHSRHTRSRQLINLATSARAPTQSACSGNTNQRNRR